MALIAEEVVEEWLNRQGFFTIRGVKVGRGEMDLLAIRVRSNRKVECRHVEVQVSVAPIGYIAIHQIKSARKRTRAEMKSEARAWVKKKFKDLKKQKVRNELCPTAADWSFHFVHGNVKEEAELAVINGFNVKLHDVRKILREISEPSDRSYDGATGKDLVDLVATFGSEARLRGRKRNR
jgi:hypothetical protein